jgi:hypothetical protein
MFFIHDNGGGAVGVLNAIYSITTDMGCELGVIKLPYLVDVFFGWLDGKSIQSMMGTVDLQSRFFPRGMAIAGWFRVHAFLMLRFVKRWHRWPEVLACIRVLCKWLRNATNRQHLAACLPHIPNIEELLESFSASLVKWRYETVHDCFCELLKLRRILTVELLRSFFPNPQDNAELGGVFEACEWEEMWQFMSVAFRSGIQKLEKSRRWGLVCACCPGLKNARCDRSSMRLHEARQHMEVLTDGFREALRNDTIALCENSMELLRFQSFSLRCSITEIWE